MNISTYIFGNFNDGYTQYPDDYSKDIFKKIESLSNDTTKLVIHRDGDLMYYSYVRKFEGEKYVGLCCVINGKYLTRIEPLFENFESLIETMLKNGYLVHFNRQGKIATDVSTLYNNRDEVDLITGCLVSYFSQLENDTTTLPPYNYSVDRNSVNILSHFDDIDTIISSSYTYSYTVIGKLEGYNTKNILHYTTVLSKKSDELERLQNDLETIKKNPRDDGGKLFLMSFLFAIVIVLIGIAFVTNHNGEKGNTKIVRSEKVENKPIEEPYIEAKIPSKQEIERLNAEKGKKSKNNQDDKVSDTSVSSTPNENQSVAQSSEMSREMPSEKTISVYGVSFKMKYVQGGQFLMGATNNQLADADSNEKPSHIVSLSSYYIGETEVTQQLWMAVMGENPSSFAGYPYQPVECVSWNDCITFIKKLNGITGEKFRLPTEAEWEFAARGGNKSKGYKYSGSDNADAVGWCKTNCGGGPHNVKTRQPNELGIYDMTGNVNEWCQDRFGSYSSSSQTNPKGASSGTARVGRGGGWCNSWKKNRVSFRNAGNPSYSDHNLGLRLAL